MREQSCVILAKLLTFVCNEQEAEPSNGAQTAKQAGTGLEALAANLKKQSDASESLQKADKKC